MFTSRKARTASAALLGALLGGSALVTSTAGATAHSTPASSPASAPAAGGGSLKGVCPDTVVIQSDWWPEGEYGHLYNLIGDGYTVDADKKSVKGALVDGGTDTGVMVEVRAGGSAITGSAAEQLATSPEVTLAQVNIEKTATIKDLKLLSVVAPLEKNPQMIMWDPATYPDVKTIADLQKHNVAVLVFGKGTIATWAISKGIMLDSQFDTSFDGSPTQFVSTGGKVAQQGFATSEPYAYENDIDTWAKPIAFQTWDDAGFKTYSQTLAILAENKEKMAPCLKLLVPIIQRSQVNYLTSPDRANAMILDAVAKYDTFWKETPELLKFAVDQQIALGIAGNGANETLGDMDEARIQTVLDELRTAGLEVPAEMKAADIFTNEFVDPSIGLAAAETTASSAPSGTQG